MRTKRLLRLIPVVHEGPVMEIPTAINPERKALLRSMSVSGKWASMGTHCVVLRNQKNFGLLCFILTFVTSSHRMVKVGRDLCGSSSPKSLATLRPVNAAWPWHLDLAEKPPSASLIVCMQAHLLMWVTRFDSKRLPVRMKLASVSPDIVESATSVGTLNLKLCTWNHRIIHMGMDLRRSLVRPSAQHSVSHDRRWCCSGLFPVGSWKI